jgi:phosphatidylglycerol:prolipoprotein diacylglycerol transferase
MSISTWVYGLEPGDWIVTAVMTRPQGHIVGRPHVDRWRRPIETLPRARWSWRRWAVSSAPDRAVQTRWSLPAPLARIPAVLPGSFPALGTLGILVALITQAAIAAQEQLSIGSSLLVSVLALVAGLIAAKVWYAILHPGPWRQSLLGGWSVDGFLVVAPLVAISALLVLDLPIGAFLDAVTPGMFFAVAIGRLGCFFTGCCAGRCTRSRWGVWSSDRRVGARRIPAQLLESIAGLLLGSTAALLVVSNVSRTPGLVFVAAIVAYIVVRQFLLRLRAERREYSWRRSEPRRA